jgi:hypothetical protein
VVDYDLFFELDPLHVGLITVDGQVVELTPNNERLVFEPAATVASSLFDFVAQGVLHILTGIDHLLFLASLLLGVLLYRRDELVVVRPLPHATRHTLVLVTAFTIAHSMTLIAAALGWITLPSRLVESVIAASIVVVAVDNLVRVDPPHRFLLTFGFGLMHGMGFASMLSPLLPPHGVVAPLLAFNVGVELGQLCVVVIALPLSWWTARALGARARNVYVRPISAIAAALGLIWLIERAFEVPLLGI